MMEWKFMPAPCEISAATCCSSGESTPNSVVRSVMRVAVPPVIGIRISNFLPLSTVVKRNDLLSGAQAAFWSSFPLVNAVAAPLCKSRRQMLMAFVCLLGMKNSALFPS